MSSSFHVLCIRKSDRLNAHERITHIGGLNSNNTKWQITQEEAINRIEQGTADFYVYHNFHKVRVIVARSKFGVKYIKSESDGDIPDNLLSLPQCQ